jgi:hypothetical protein
VRPSRARDGLARLGDGLVRDAARVEDRDLRVARALLVTVGEQALADLAGVRMRDLAAEEADGKRGHSRAV